MSRTSEYIKHRLVCSPLGGVLDAARGLANRSRALRHPELSRLLREDAAIDRMFGMILKPEMNCVDCGCHIGSVMRVFHSFCPRGTHVGVEALPHKVEWLRARFPRATFHQVAVGDSEGEVTFHFDTDASARSSMHKNAAIKHEQTLTVPLRTLDGLLGLNSDRGGGGAIASTSSRSTSKEPNSSRFAGQRASSREISPQSSLSARPRRLNPSRSPLPMSLRSLIR